jgi:hypothetical protein
MQDNVQYQSKYTFSQGSGAVSWLSKKQQLWLFHQWKQITRQQKLQLVRLSGGGEFQWICRYTGTRQHAIL